MAALRPQAPNPEGLAAHYRLSVTPKSEPKVKIRRSKKNRGDDKSSDVKSSTAVPDVQYRFWLLDDDLPEIDFEEDEEEEETPVGEVLEESQRAYLSACRDLQITPIARFTRSLLTERVSMKNQRLPPAQTKAIAIALARNGRVESLSLEANELGLVGVRRIAEMLPAKMELTELCIVDNALGTKGAKIICDVLMGNTTIRKLDLSGNNFNESAAPYIKELLEESVALREVSLSHNSFREKGGIILAAGIANNDFLKRLDLSWNHLRMEGAIAIGNSLKENNILEVLNLGWNGFHLRGCQTLGQALETNRSLVELDLSCNRINPICLAQLIKYLSSNDTLKVLKLPLNPLYPEGAMTILRLLQKFPVIPLTEIDLGRQSVYEDFVELLEELKEQRPLKVIYGEVLRGLLEFKLPVPPAEEPASVEDLIDELPLVVLMEYLRQQNLRVIDVFHIIDADKDHSITREEFKEGLETVGIPMTPKALDNLLDELDKDKQGDVDIKELTAAFQQYRQDQREAMASDDYDSSDFGRISARIQEIMKKRYVMRQW